MIASNQRINAPAGGEKKNKLWNGGKKLLRKQSSSSDGVIPRNGLSPPPILNNFRENEPGRDSHEDYQEFPAGTEGT